MPVALRAACSLVWLAGCNQVLGLDAPAIADAVTGDPDAPADARDGDADPDAGVDAPAGLCDTQPEGTPDEDFDSRRDACDNCPHIRQVDGWLDEDNDGVGNACDPRPGAPDRLALFYGFEEPAVTFDPIVGGASGNWHIGGGRLLLQDAVHGAPYLARFPVLHDTVTVATQVTPREQPTAIPETSRSVGVWAMTDPNNPTADPAGVVLETAETWGAMAPVRHFAHVVDSASTGLFDDSLDDVGLWQYDQPYQLTLTCVAATGACSGTVQYDQVVHAVAIVGVVTRAGAVGLRAHGIAAEFDYLAVIVPRPPS